MSGPKCSSYQLSIQRRQEELRKIEEQLRKEAEEKRREEKRRREEARRKAEEARRKAEEEERKRQEELRIKNEEMTKEAAAIAEKIARKRRERKQKEAEEEEKKRQEQEWEAYNERLLAEEAVRKEELLKKREQEIIAEAIDEAMEELGYDLIASKTAKKDAPVYAQAQVFSFAEGVGVQVIETEDRISMEIVGIGTNNRKPTENESEYLETQMGSFCDAYDKLEEKLKEKGIVKANTIHRLPPDKKYARILNVENYENKKDTKTLQTVMRKQTKQTQDVQIAAKKLQMKRNY